MEGVVETHFWGTIFLGLYVTAWGVVLAPLGSLICGLIAYRRKLGVAQWMGRGLVGSALFLFPWLYVVASVSGMRISLPLKRVEYALAYLAWLVGPIGLMINLVTGSFVAQWRGIPDGFLDYPLYYTFCIAVATVSLYTWFMSIRRSIWELRDSSTEFDVSFYRVWLAVIVWSLAFLALLVIFFTIELQEWRQRTM